MEFNCLKTTEPIQQNNLIFTTKTPGVLGTHLIDFWSMKGLKESNLEPPNDFQPQTPCFETQCPNH